jgi:glycerophosphoryl diester phosphodiesterase
MTLKRFFFRAILVISIAAVLLLTSQDLLVTADAKAQDVVNYVIGRAVLPAATFAPGPTSGTRLGAGPINGQVVPFLQKQPVQGFSAVLENGDGTFLAMSDNGFGSLETSADYHLRGYIIRPKFIQVGQPGDLNSGAIQVEGYIEIHDPDQHVPFAITNHFTTERVLTGADFDIESMQRTPDGTLWFGDEFGPFLLHTDANGKVLEPPIPLPDFDNPGKNIRSPQHPFNEEASAVRLMNAVRTHAQLHANHKAPVFSPWHVMLDDGNPDTFIDNRAAPPEGSGLEPASSEIFNITSLQSAGYPIVTWTVNEKARMLELMTLGVNGIISDRPHLLRQAVEEFDANGDGLPGDFLDAEGLIDISKFDAQGHRGGRNLRPENTLPAMEVALDSLMSTLETDSGITADGIPVLDHDPHVEAAKCRLAFDPTGTVYTEANQVLVKDLTVAVLQHSVTGFICDKLLDGRPDQTNDLSLSPVTVAFATLQQVHPYVMPTVQQLFDFVNFYVEYYRSGPGNSHLDAARRWKNALQVRFNVETKINPRAQFADRTIEPEPFAQKVASVIMANALHERVDMQSFDFRSLLVVQAQFPQIRTVYLFGDFPIFADPSIPGSDDGTNLQDENGANTPWLAGLFWPYRVTTLEHPFRSQRSGGFEGMALTPDASTLLPLLEKPLVGGAAQTLLIHAFDIAARAYTGQRYTYLLNPRGTAIGDFILFGARHGLVIERDDTQGDVNGFKVVYEVELQGTGEPVQKTVAVDLMNLTDQLGISTPGEPGDVGIGPHFAFPFVTIEDVVLFDRSRIGVLNDNNYPFSVGRHVGAGLPDDTEFIVIQLGQTLGTNTARE